MFEVLAHLGDLHISCGGNCTLRDATYPSRVEVGNELHEFFRQSPFPRWLRVACWRFCYPTGRNFRNKPIPRPGRSSMGSSHVHRHLAALLHRHMLVCHRVVGYGGADLAL